MKVFEKGFERQFTELDWKKNIPFPVEVPKGVRRLRVELDFAPHMVGGYANLLTLTVFDPAGWRGSGHRHGSHQEVTIGTDGATPGYLAGKIAPGEWIVEIDTHMVMPGEGLAVKLSVSGDDEPETVTAPVPVVGKTAPRGPGWYRGDLHAHTLNSDARWDVAGLLAFAREHRLDFTTLSDHNTVAGLGEMLAATSDDLLTLGGMELTTFRGHALALGVHHWVDWRVQPGERSMTQVAEGVLEEGGLFVIAHPTSPGDPYCTGCDWRFAELMPGIAPAVEVWNMDWRAETNNEAALALVYGWLNQGCRLALTAGTDNHGELPDLKYGYNVVYAEEFSESEIIRAIRAGHIYLSSGPRLELTARAGGQAGMMGDSLDAASGEKVRLSAKWSGGKAGDRAALVLDGEEREQAPAKGEGQHAWEIRGGEARWGMVTLRDGEGTMLALTNPVYFDGRGAQNGQTRP